MNSGRKIRPNFFQIAAPLSLDEAEESIRNYTPLEVGAVGYFPSFICLMGLPHHPLNQSYYKCRSGLLETSIVADPTIGLPFGRASRLMLIWLVTQSKLNNSSVIDFGNSQAEFFKIKLGIQGTGGETGTIQRYADQLDRLCRCVFTVIDQRNIPFEFTNYLIAHKGPLFNMPMSLGGRNMLGLVQLELDFFNYLKRHSVPIDLRAVAALESTYSLDLYLFLTFRLRGLSKPLLLSWSQLMQQLGYPHHEEKTGPFRACKHRLIRNINEVRRVYPSAKFCIQERGVLFHRSTGSVPGSRLGHR
jgi:hypothetical protein